MSRRPDRAASERKAEAVRPNWSTSIAPGDSNGMRLHVERTKLRTAGMAPFHRLTDDVDAETPGTVKPLSLVVVAVGPKAHHEDVVGVASTVAESSSTIPPNG
jgi:hypothetical protein